MRDRGIRLELERGLKMGARVGKLLQLKEDEAEIGVPHRIVWRNIDQVFEERARWFARAFTVQDSREIVVRAGVCRITFD
jgi:hypothetical protein